MVVDGPAAIGHRVGEDPVGQDVVLRQYVVAHQTAALPDAGEHAHPVQVVVLRPVVPAVFQVVPHAVNAPHQLVADALIFVDDVRSLAGQLDPPVAIIQAVAVEGLLLPRLLVGVIDVRGAQQQGLVVAVAPELQIVLCEVAHPVRRGEAHRPAPVHRLEQQGVAHAVVVGRLRGVGLLELRLPLAAGAVVRPGEIAQGAVAGAVDEHLGGDPQMGLRGALVADDPPDLVPLQLHVVHARVEQQRQVLLAAGHLQQGAVPDGVIVVVVAGLVLQHDLVDDAGLRRVPLELIGVRAANVHPDLGAGVSPQHSPVLNQHGPDSLPGAGQRRAQARHAAADNRHIKRRVPPFAACPHRFHLPLNASHFVFCAVNFSKLPLICQYISAIHPPL